MTRGGPVHFAPIAHALFAALENHMPDLLTEHWYAHSNDLIGGWSILNRDHPPSGLSREADPDGREIGEFLTEQVARHIVALHNATLGDAP